MKTKNMKVIIHPLAHAINTDENPSLLPYLPQSASHVYFVLSYEWIKMDMVV